MHTDITQLGIYTICNKFSTQPYCEFNLVFVSLSPFSICVPVYSEKYLRSSIHKHFFHKHI
jgi:hypothetical protein